MPAAAAATALRQSGALPQGGLTNSAQLAVHEIIREFDGLAPARTAAGSSQWRGGYGHDTRLWVDPGGGRDGGRQFGAHEVDEELEMGKLLVGLFPYGTGGGAGRSGGSSAARFGRRLCL